MCGKRDTRCEWEVEAEERDKEEGPGKRVTSTFTKWYLNVKFMLCHMSHIAVVILIPKSRFSSIQSCVLSIMS